MKEQLLNKVENILTEGEIAHNEQFILLPQCFQKSSSCCSEVSESIYRRGNGQGLPSLDGIKPFPHATNQCRRQL